MKEINDNAKTNDHYAGHDNVLANVTVHYTKVIFTRSSVGDKRF
jgi:hypothetical protein